MTKCALCDDEAKVTCDFCEKPFCQKHWSGHGHTVPYGEEINAATEEEKQSQINAIQNAHLKEAETYYTQNRKDQAELRHEEEALAEEAEDERLEEEEKRKKKEYHPYEDPLFLVPVIGPLITAGKVLWQMLAGDEEEEEP